MLDLTVGETKEFERLPEDQWIPARLTKREVIQWDEDQRKFFPREDKDLKVAFKAVLSYERGIKGGSDGSDAELKVLKDTLYSHRLNFLFQPLGDKKFAEYRVRMRTGITISFNAPDGTYAPNNLGKLYLDAGGKTAAKNERIDLDSIIGNYVAIKVENTKNKTNNRIYQQVIGVRQLTDAELARAKAVENEIRTIEEEVEKEREKLRARGGDVEVQSPVLENDNGEIAY